MKKWYESKTIWINVLSIILEIVNVLLDNPIIPPKYAGILTVGVNIINIVLRALTTKQLSK